MSTWYKAGTASFANGSATVTGSGTSWVDNVKIGDALRAPDGRAYEIVELVSSSELEIRPAYEGLSESNADYAIQPTRGILQRVFNQIQGWLDEAEADNYLLSDKNLSDLDSAPTSRDNLGLGSAATEDDSRYVNVTDTQTIAGTKTFSGGVEAASYGGDGVTQSATDTTAGRLSKVGDFGLGTSNGITLTSADDLDDITVSGFYNWENGSRPDNTPASGFFSMLVLGAPGDDVTQIVFRVGNETNHAKSFIRSFGSGEWQQWLVNYTGQNILGTVAETDGKPTGAVIERGSNSNGDYILFADGTLIAWNLLSSTPQTWTFPVPITQSSFPRISATPRSGSARVPIVRDVVRESALIEARDLDNNLQDVLMQVVVYGHWF